MRLFAIAMVLMTNSCCGSYGGFTSIYKCFMDTRLLAAYNQWPQGLQPLNATALQCRGAIGLLSLKAISGSMHAAISSATVIRKLPQIQYIKCMV